MLYLIAYDINDNRTRDKVATMALDVGIRVQYSVFEADINGKEAKTLFYKLKKELSRHTDRLIVAPSKEIISFTNIHLSISKNLWIV